MTWQLYEDRNTSTCFQLAVMLLGRIGDMWALVLSFCKRQFNVQFNLQGSN